FPGVVEAVGVVDQRLVTVLFPIIGILIFQPPGIEAQKGILREEKRAAVIEAEGEGKAIEGFTVAEEIATRPTLMVNVSRNRIATARSCKDVHDQAFVPAVNRKVHGPAVIGTPV